MSEFEYPYINELNLAVQAVIYEVKTYLFNQKFAITQTTLDFEAVPDAPFDAGKMVDTDTGVVTQSQLKPKRGRKQKVNLLQLQLHVNPRRRKELFPAI